MLSARFISRRIIIQSVKTKINCFSTSAPENRLHSLYEKKDFGKLDSTFDQIKDKGDVTVIEYNTMLNSYADRQIDDKYHHLFEQMRRDGSANLDTYSSIMNRAVENKDIKALEDAFSKLKEVELLPSGREYHLLLRGYGESHAYDRMERTYNQMIENGITLDLSVFEIMTHFYHEADDAKRMFLTLEHMIERDFPPDEVMYRRMLSTFAKGHHNAKISFVLNRIQAHIDQVNTADYFNFLIHKAFVIGDHPRMITFFEEMKNKQLEPSSDTYHFMCLAYARQFNLNAAEDVFDEMRAKNIVPALHTYNWLIYYYANDAIIDRMEQKIEQMEQDGVAPNILTYNNRILGYSRAKMIQRVEETFNEIADNHVKANHTSYNLVLQAYVECELYQQMEIFFLDMQPFCHPNLVTYKIVINGLKLSGQLEKAEKVHDQMKEDLKPTAEQDDGKVPDHIITNPA